jgi:hypothetical protein
MTHDGTRDALEEKLIEWFQLPGIQAKNWAPRLFWIPDDQGRPFGLMRVDPRELEVVFATVLGEASACRETLDKEENGRGGFLATNARRHELPLLKRNSR